MSDHVGANGGRFRPPTIKLDRTLQDLYDQYCPSLKTKRIAHVFCGTTCTADLSADFPRNKKYFYQDGAFNDASQSTKTDAEVQRMLAAKYLSLIPQRDAFIAGDAPVIFFYSGSSKEEIEHDEAEAERTLAVLDESQRPEIIFTAGPSGFSEVAAAHSIDALTMKLVVDGLVDAGHSEDVRVRTLIDPDILWRINSKEALAKSGLPTPKSDTVDVCGHLPAASNCCEACEGLDDSNVPEDCTGPRRRWLGDQIVRILSAIERQALPFVMKNQQTFGGAGTYVITTEPERNQLLEDLTTGGILSRMFCHVNSENQHLRPGTILLTKMIEAPVADHGVTFFVCEDGSTAYLAASEQMIDRENHSWVGSSINYGKQSNLEDRFGSLVHKTGSWLHKQGYIGPAGIDILETQEGNLEIVDLNVRTSGSLCLPLLQHHFTSRGFHCATSMSVTVGEPRQEFCEQWREQIESGQLCILAWYDSVGKSFGDVVIGAEEAESLAEILAKIRQVSDEVTF